LLGRPRRTGLRRGHPHWHSSSLPFSRSTPVAVAPEGRERHSESGVLPPPRFLAGPVCGRSALSECGGGMGC